MDLETFLDRARAQGNCLSRYRLDPVAIEQLDAIYAYTLDRWGEAQQQCARLNDAES